MSVAGLCMLLGYSKQAYYKRMSHREEEQLQAELLIEMIRKVRKRMPRLGGRKLLVVLHDKFERAGIQMGRDAFFDFLREHALLIKPRRRYVRTTLSSHWLRKYDNLVAGFRGDKVNRIWVCDITYVETEEGFVYLYLITDAYSKKIIGHHVSDDLKGQSATAALKRAISLIKTCAGIIHHSDRGVQYCSEAYIQLLTGNKMRISMSEPGSPTQNAIAERVNGILKDEWIYEYAYASKQQAKEHIDEIISIYNNERPHGSCSMLTPAQAHQHPMPLKKMWKKYARKTGSTLGTSEASAVSDVTEKQNAKRLPEQTGSLRATSVTAPAIPLAVKSQQACHPLHRASQKNQDMKNQRNKFVNNPTD